MSQTETGLSKPNQQIAGPRKVSEILAEHLHMDPKGMVEVIKAQCFKSVDPSKVTNEQLAAYVSVASSLAEQCPGFNPVLPGMLYAFPSKNGGIEPMIGPDGVFALLSSRSDISGWETEIEADDKGEIVSAVATVHRVGKMPVVKRVLLKEWKVPSNPNWNTRPAHMLELRALKQAARQIIHGMPMDEDERRMIQAHEVQYEKADAPRLGGPEKALKRLTAAPATTEAPPVTVENPSDEPQPPDDIPWDVPEQPSVAAPAPHGDPPPRKAGRRSEAKGEPAEPVHGDLAGEV